MKYILVLTLTFTLNLMVYAQTCCSSGVPIASNLGFEPQGKRVLQISAALEYNRLTTLYNGREVLDDNRRLRTTNSLLTRLGYGLNRKISVEFLVPFVRQLREVTLNSGEKEQDGGQGLGDLTTLFQLLIIENQFSNFTIGGGVKLPTGANNLKNKNGLLLINDLQVGSNSTDFLARISAMRNVTMRPSMSFFISSTAIFRGTNNEYLRTESYRFGNEIQATMGYSDQVFFWKTLAYPSLSVRFRHALQDLINDNLLSNTGGTWVFARAGVGIDIYKGNRISVAGEYPIYTKVDGIQLSPDFIINVSYYKAIDFSKEEF